MLGHLGHEAVSTPAAPLSKLEQVDVATPHTPPSVRYIQAERLANGAYGIVYRGVDSTTGSSVALKRIPLHTVGNDALRRDLFPASTGRIARKEKSVLSNLLPHRHVCKLLDSYEDNVEVRHNVYREGGDTSVFGNCETSTNAAPPLPLSHNYISLNN